MLVKINQSISQDVRECKAQITANLEEYNHISRAMRELEKFFMVNFLRPGYILKQARDQRAYLEKEYQRIRASINNHLYKSIQELEAEIHNVLVHSDNAYQADQRSFEDEQVKAVNLWEIVENLDPQDVAADYDEGQITDDFKRIVLPATHPDTSDTPREVFLTVMGVYKAQDFLLMEAYVAQYREEDEPDEAQDILTTHEKLSQRQREYHQLSGRMERRLKAIKKELDPQELDHPEKIKENILKLREEVKRSIQLETEKIFELRFKIQELTQLFIKLKRMDDDG